MDQLEAALGEYKQASEYDPSNRLISVKVADLDKTIRDRVEAARPKPQIQQLRERARAASTPPPLLNFTTPLRRMSFNNTSLRDILNFIASSTGINVTFDRQYTDRAFTVQLDGVTLEQALNQILSVNQLSYKVLSEQSILVFDDNAQKHAQYDEQVIQTFYLSNSDPTEMAQLLSTVLRPPGVAVQPQIVAEQDRQLGHDPRHGADGPDLREDHPAERQAARRDRRGRRDHGGQPAAGEAVRAEPVGVRARRHLLARSVAQPARRASRPARRRRPAEARRRPPRPAADRRRRAASRRRRRST